VKPENVLISTRGEVKVADFGLVRAVSSMTMATGDVILGTVAYLSPEQVSTGYSDQRSDVYAAGIVGCLTWWHFFLPHFETGGPGAFSIHRYTALIQLIYLLLLLSWLALPLPLLSCVLLLLLDAKVVVRGQLKLLQTQRMVGLINRDTHCAAALYDRLAGPLQPLLSGVDRVGAHRAYTVVGLDVVSAQHQVAELANEGRSFLQRTVDHPAGFAAYGRPLPDRFLDRRAKLVQALFRGQDVIERMPELVVPHFLQKSELVSLDDRLTRLPYLLVERCDVSYEHVPAPGKPLQLRLNGAKFRLQ
jgi:hypothetical protein